MKTSIIVPTYNRPSELKDCILSVVRQTVKPDELIIVDDGNLSEIPLKEELEAAGIHALYLKKSRPGLTESRNRGIELASGDIIFFFDDDVILDADYVEETLKVYAGDGEKKIGAVGGIQKNRYSLKKKDYLLWFSEIFFLVNGFREGTVLPSGFCVDYGTTPFSVTEKAKVDFLAGCAMSFRKEIFNEFSFDDKRYIGYGLGEDKDFTYRVSKKHAVIVNPEAKLLHLESPKMRDDKITMGYNYALSNYSFFKNLVQKTSFSRILFYYALSGYLISRTLVFLTSPSKENLGRIIGIFRGIRRVCRSED